MSTIIGTNNSETLLGTSKADTIFGLGGNDLIYAQAGNDTIDGGSGNDTIYADGGNDTLVYRRSENVGATDFYDGEGGMDTLQLKLTDTEYSTYVNELFQYQQLISANSSSTNTFHFSFGLTATEIENLQVTIVDANGNAVANRTAPNASNVSAKGQEDASSIAITLKASDSDKFSSISSFDVVSLPTNGTLYTDSALTNPVTINTYYTATSNTLTLYFKPDPNFNGKVSFNYTAKDNTGLIDLTPATASITVTSVNDAPETNNVSASGLNSASYISIVLSGSDVDGFVNSFHINSLPSNGTLYTDSTLTTQVSTAGNTFYSATNNQLTLYFDPADNFSGDVTFSYSARDNQGLIDSSPATATITVTESMNVAPVATNDIASTNEDTPLVINSTSLTTNDFDVENDPLSVTAVSNAVNGSVILNAGVITFTPTENFNGAASFEYTVSDGQGGTDTGTVNVEVNPINDAPIASGTATLGSVNEDTSLNATVSSLFSGNFSDAADQVLNGSSANTFAGIAISNYIANAAEGQWQYSTDGATWTNLNNATPETAVTLNGTDMLRFIPTPNYNGSATTLSANLIESGQSITTGETVNLTGATGGTTHISTATVALSGTINAVNDAPVITSNDGGDTAATSIPENSTAVTTVTATDVDTPLSSLTYILSGVDAAFFSLSGVNGNILSFNTAPDFEAPFGGNTDNIYDVIVTVSDGTDSDSQAIAVTVTNVIGTQSLFTTENDTVDFNNPIDPDVYDPTLYYDAQEGDDTVTLPDLANAAAINYDFLQQFNAGAGNDIVYSGDYNDIINGGLGTDTVSYQLAGNTVIVNLSILTPQNTFSAGIDTLSGFENIIGSNSSDTLIGDDGDNVIDGGFNIIGSGVGNDTLNGGLGTDTVSYATASAGVTVSLALQGASQDTVGAGLDTLFSFENLTGSNFNDTLTGDTNSNTIDGSSGNDTIDGGAGNVNDTLVGGAGIDTLSYASLTAGIGVDGTIGQTVNLSTPTSTGAGGTDTLASLGFENIIGSNFNDTLTGDVNSNTIFGGAGNDIIEGGLGKDTLDGGTSGGAGDQFKYNFITESSGVNADQINNYDSIDSLLLNHSTFNGDGNTDGLLDIGRFEQINNFNSGSPSSTAMYIYDGTSNQLYYDPDAGNHGDAVLFIEFDNTSAPLKETDIHFF